MCITDNICSKLCTKQGRNADFFPIYFLRKRCWKWGKGLAERELWGACWWAGWALNSCWESRSECKGRQSQQLFKSQQMGISPSSPLLRQPLSPVTASSAQNVPVELFPLDAALCHLKFPLSFHVCLSTHPSNDHRSWPTAPLVKSWASSLSPPRTCHPLTKLKATTSFIFCCIPSLHHICAFSSVTWTDGTSS